MGNKTLERGLVSGSNNHLEKSARVKELDTELISVEYKGSASTKAHVGY